MIAGHTPVELSRVARAGQGQLLAPYSLLIRRAQQASIRPHAAAPGLSDDALVTLPVSTDSMLALMDAWSQLSKHLQQRPVIPTLSGSSSGSEESLESTDMFDAPVSVSSSDEAAATSQLILTALKLAVCSLSRTVSTVDSTPASSIFGRNIASPSTSSNLQDSTTAQSAAPAVQRSLALAVALAELYAAGMPLDGASIAAGIVAEAVDASLLHINTVAARLGPHVAALVHDVLAVRHAPDRVPSYDDTSSSALRGWILSAYDVRAAAIEVVWRWLDLAGPLSSSSSSSSSNSSSGGGGGRPQHQAQLLAMEALTIYCPLGHALGLGVCAAGLEDAAFKVLFPSSYASTARQVLPLSAAANSTLAQCEAALSQALEDDVTFSQLAAGVRLLGRAKSLYSIMRKLLRLQDPAAGSRRLGQMYDLLGLRAVVLPRPDLDPAAAEAAAVQACYRLQEVAQQLWHPLPHRTKDYIAQPKANGYQSLHTTLALSQQPAADGSSGSSDGSSGSSGSSGSVVLSYLELQVRTAAMHAAAEGGDAAHSGYKGRLGRRQVRQLQQWTEQLQRRLAAPQPQTLLLTAAGSSGSSVSSSSSSSGVVFRSGPDFSDTSLSDDSMSLSDDSDAESGASPAPPAATTAAPTSSTRTSSGTGGEGAAGMQQQQRPSANTAAPGSSSTTSSILGGSSGSAAGTQQQQQQPPAATTAAAAELFHHLDLDGDGHLSLYELTVLLHELGTPAALLQWAEQQAQQQTPLLPVPGSAAAAAAARTAAAASSTAAYAQQILELLDTNGDGLVSLQEFMAFYMNAVHSSSSSSSNDSSSSSNGDGSSDDSDGSDGSDSSSSYSSSSSTTSSHGSNARATTASTLWSKARARAAAAAAAHGSCGTTGAAGPPAAVAFAGTTALQPCSSSSSSLGRSLQRRQVVPSSSSSSSSSSRGLQAASWRSRALPSSSAVGVDEPDTLTGSSSELDGAGGSAPPAAAAAVPPAAPAATAAAAAAVAAAAVRLTRAPRPTRLAGRSSGLPPVQPLQQSSSERVTAVTTAAAAAGPHSYGSNGTSASGSSSSTRGVVAGTVQGGMAGPVLQKGRQQQQQQQLGAEQIDLREQQQRQRGRLLQPTLLEDTAAGTAPCFVLLPVSASSSYSSSSNGSSWQPPLSSVSITDRLGQQLTEVTIPPLGPLLVTNAPRVFGSADVCVDVSTDGYERLLLQLEVVRPAGSDHAVLTARNLSRVVRRRTAAATLCINGQPLLPPHGAACEVAPGDVLEFGQTGVAFQLLQRPAAPQQALVASVQQLCGLYARQQLGLSLPVDSALQRLQEAAALPPATPQQQQQQPSMTLPVIIGVGAAAAASNAAPSAPGTTTAAAAAAPQQEQQHAGHVVPPPLPPLQQQQPPVPEEQQPPAIPAAPSSSSAAAAAAAAPDALEVQLRNISRLVRTDPRGAEQQLATLAAQHPAAAGPWFLWAQLAAGSKRPWLARQLFRTAAVCQQQEMLVAAAAAPAAASILQQQQNQVAPQQDTAAGELAAGEQPTAPPSTASGSTQSSSSSSDATFRLTNRLTQILRSWGKLEWDARLFGPARRLWRLAANEAFKFPYEVSSGAGGAVLHCWASAEYERSNILNARVIIGEALRKCPRDAAVAVLAGSIEAAAGEEASARALFTRAYGLNKADKQLYMAWPRMEGAAGNVDRARELYRAGLTLYPSNIKIMNLFGCLEEDQGNVELARELHQAALNIDSSSVTSMHNRVSWARLELRSGNLDVARQLLREGLDAHPDFTAALLLSAQLERLCRRLDVAEAYARRAQKIDAFAVAASRELQAIYRARGEPQLAANLERHVQLAEGREALKLSGRAHGNTAWGAYYRQVDTAEQRGLIEAARARKQQLGLIRQPGHSLQQAWRAGQQQQQQQQQGAVDRHAAGPPLQQQQQRSNKQQQPQQQRASAAGEEAGDDSVPGFDFAAAAQAVQQQVTEAQRAPKGRRRRQQLQPQR